MISSYSTLSSLLKTDRVRLIGVTSRQPHPAFPDVPPLIGTLPGFSSETWVGVFAPAGTPPRLVERLNREISEISASPELKNILEPDGMLPLAMAPAAFAARIRQEFEQWRQIALDLKLVE
jgi:tripartite-type tricarboxylate transporter receptor subunit TctC